MKIYEMKVALNPRRVRIFLAEKNIDVEYVQVDLLKGEHRTTEFKEKNRFGFLPVLELDNGTHISESVAICRYFEELHPEPNLFGRDPIEKAKVEMWNRRCELYFMMPTGMCFQHTSDYWVGMKKQVPEWGELCHKNAEKFFDVLNDRLADNEFIAGGHFSIADISAFCTVEFSKVVKLRIKEEQTHLQRWHNSMKERPSSKA